MLKALPGLVLQCLADGCACPLPDVISPSFIAIAPDAPTSNFSTRPLPVWPLLLREQAGPKITGKAPSPLGPRSGGNKLRAEGGQSIPGTTPAGAKLTILYTLHITNNNTNYPYQIPDCTIEETICRTDAPYSNKSARPTQVCVVSGFKDAF